MADDKDPRETEADDAEPGEVFYAAGKTYIQTANSGVVEYAIDEYVTAREVASDAEHD